MEIIIERLGLAKEFRAEYDVAYYDDSDDRYLKDFDESVRENIIKSSYDLDGDGKLETIYTVINGNKSAIFLVFA